MKLNFTHDTLFDNDLQEVLRAFLPYITKGDEYFLQMLSTQKQNQLKVKFVSDCFLNFQKQFLFEIPNGNSIERKRFIKRYLKIALYRTLSFLSNVDLPYGCLTGIRPTKLFRELGSDASNIFRNDFSVKGEKIKLVENIVKTQNGINRKKGMIDLFINIPFCPTKCSYCSFVSSPINKQKNIVADYVDCLIEQLKCHIELIKSQNRLVRCVYIGGGTPTAIPLESLERILALCDLGQTEFTVEAGRPDTISKETVALLKKYAVSRVSVNPQTFDDNTLKTIGRNHSVDDIFTAYELVKGVFDVNMDLIAALPGETLGDFRHSIDCALELEPENITVHTLCLKRGSKLNEIGYPLIEHERASAMVDYAQQSLIEGGYLPYYMYRQKYSANLENVGFSKPEKECIYNIDIMEEDTSIMAVGAGAIAKKYTEKSNLIERYAHVKEPLDFVKRFDEQLKGSIEFWK